MTSLPDTIEARKRLGAWYTSDNLVRPLVDWAITSPSDRVMDPSCGDGAFLIAAAARLRALRPTSSASLLGFDLSADAIAVTSRALATSKWSRPGQILHTSDFFAVHPPLDVESSVAPVDAVVGNPPYIRYQSFSGVTRQRAAERCRHQGVKIAGLASSWAPFVVHAASFLQEGGRLAMVLPEELVHAAYAAPIRKYLREHFSRTAIISFESHVFPDTQERVVLLAASGYQCARVGTLQIRRLKDPAELVSIDVALVGADVYRPDEEGPEKWMPGARDQHHDVLSELESAGLFVRLSAIARAGIGYVSGANDFFILSRTLADEHAIPLRGLQPTLSAARHCAGTVINPTDFSRLVDKDERVLLLRVGRNPGAAVQKYLQSGEQAGIPNRFKCRVRNPWFEVPGVIVPDAFLTYMSDEGPRLALNSAGASCSNTLHGVRFHALPRHLHRVFAWSFYSSITQLSAELVGRSYGGGVLKLEPSEAGRLLVPSRGLLDRVARGGSLFRVVDLAVRKGERGAVERVVDAALLARHAGLSSRKQVLIREALAALRSRRLGGRRLIQATNGSPEQLGLVETA